MDEFVGAVVMEIDGREVECSDISITEKTGKIPVKAMTRKGRIAGYARGIAEYTLSFTTHIPIDESPVDFDNADDVKIVLEPISEGGTRTAYTGVCFQEIGKEFKTDGEATRKVTAFAQDKREE